MSTPSEEEARAALDKLHRFSFGATDEIQRTDIAGLVQVISDALASRVSTPPSETHRDMLLSELREAQGDGSDWTEDLFKRAADFVERTPSSEQGSCWDEGPTLPVRDGECAPMPPRCELQAGHLGAHRGPRNMHGLATEWMTRPAAPPVSEDWEYATPLDSVDGRFWVRVNPLTTKSPVYRKRRAEWEPVPAVPVPPTKPAWDSEWVTAPDGEQFRRGACQGHACCTAKVHEHGCFADHDGTRCDHPEEHPAPTEPEEKR